MFGGGNQSGTLTTTSNAGTPTQLALRKDTSSSQFKDPRPEMQVIQLVTEATNNAFLRQIDKVTLQQLEHTITSDQSIPPATRQRFAALQSEFARNPQRATEFIIGFKYAAKLQFQKKFDVVSEANEKLVLAIAAYAVELMLLQKCTLPEAQQSILTTLNERFGVLIDPRAPISVIKLALAFLKNPNQDRDPIAAFFVSNDIYGFCAAKGILNPLTVQGLTEFETKLISSYDEFFKLMAQHVQRCRLPIEVEDFEVLCDTVAANIRKAPAELVDDTIVELMESYTLYPQFQPMLLPVILNEADAVPISINAQLGLQEKRDLQQVAQRFRQGLEQPSPSGQAAEIPLSLAPAAGSSALIPLAPAGTQALVSATSSDRSILLSQPQQVEQTVELFTQANTLLAAFTGCSRTDASEENLQKAAAIALGLIKKALTVAELNALYTFARPYLNQSALGLNTSAWQMVAKAIRDEAFDTLVKDIAAMKDTHKKLEKLRAVKEMPLFAEHRNNFKINGAFGKTATVKKIDELIAAYEYEEQFKTKIEETLKLQTGDGNFSINWEDSSEILITIDMISQSIGNLVIPTFAWDSDEVRNLRDKLADVKTTLQKELAKKSLGSTEQFLSQTKTLMSIITAVFETQQLINTIIKPLAKQQIVNFSKLYKSINQYQQQLLKLSIGDKICIAFFTFIGALVGATFGGVGGFALGTAAGTGAGSVVPVFGNAAGAITGGGIGGAIGVAKGAALGAQAGLAAGTAVGAVLGGVGAGLLARWGIFQESPNKEIRNFAKATEAFVEKAEIAADPGLFFRVSVALGL